MLMVGRILPRRARGGSRARAARLAGVAVLGTLLVGAMIIAEHPREGSAKVAIDPPRQAIAAVPSRLSPPVDAWARRIGRVKPASRSVAKRPAPAAAKPAHARPLRVLGNRYATAALNVRTRPGGGTVVTVLPVGARVKVTASSDGRWRQILNDGQGRWVRQRYLSAVKPTPRPRPRIALKARSAPKRATPPRVRTAARTRSASRPRASAACPGGSAVERGLTPDA